MFGLPDGVLACLFDMDGVVTQTATVHAAAWKQMFDEFLRQRAQSTGTEFVPFDPHHEYDAYVDGKPRLDGTRSFLESRGIHLPEGTPDDPPGTPTLYGLSNRKNNLVLQKIAAGGVRVYEGSITYIKAVRAGGIATAVVSASANTGQVLASAVVFEDAQAGVAAGHAGHFALVVGVDRVGQADELREHGADIVVKDLSDLLGHDGGTR
jgi:beta-phosphoglucomutase-like phosphatase (HAD superfamily)